MKILVHDYSGHAFPIELSRWLTGHGHQVVHVYSADIESPRGDMRTRPDDQLVIKGISTGKKLSKYNIPVRLLQERNYSRHLREIVRNFVPEVVLSNAPPNVQNALRRATQKQGGSFVYWLQDIYSAMLTRLLREKLGRLSNPIAAAVRAYDYAVMRKSDAVVAIAEDFIPYCIANGVHRDRVFVVHNWASLHDLDGSPRRNAWSKAQGLDDRFVFLFSGTLGLKHNPALLSGLAAALSDRPTAVVAVVSQGAGRQFLENEKRARKLENLLLFDYQPFADLPNVLGTADVVVAILEPFAGELSVPSKVLNYFCTGRPILAAIPSRNLAARMVADSGAGTVVPPEDFEAFIAAARAMLDDREGCDAASKAAREYAEVNFDIDLVGIRFMEIFSHARRTRQGRQRLS